MAEHIQCRVCDSLYCDGCNNYILSKMLHNGKFDCIMDDCRTIKLSADVVEVKRGKWLNIIFTQRYICSLCGNEIYFGKAKYCSECGAKMDGTSKERDGAK